MDCRLLVHIFSQGNKSIVIFKRKDYEISKL